MDSKNMMDKLQSPFLPDEIEWRVGATNGKPKANPPVVATKGIALAYVTNRAIQNRLDNVFGAFGWKNEFAEWKGKSQICGISVWDEDKKEWVTKYDGADDSNMDGTKGGLSDAMKRAAYQWGIGRYLYKLPQIWVSLKNGKYLAETPQLPPWALPEECKAPNSEGHDKDKTPESEGSKDGDNPTITDVHVSAMFNLAKKKGVSPAGVKKTIVKQFDKTDVNKLTDEEYQKLYKSIEGMKDVAQEGK